MALEAASHNEVPLLGDCCLITSPPEVKSGIWERLLSAHPDRRYASFIINSIQRGFRIGCNASRSDLRSSTRNMVAAYSNSSVVDKYLKDELECSRLVVQLPLAEVIHMSKLGVVPKKHQPGIWRLIVHLLSPKGASTNDFVSPAFCSLSYASVEDAAAYVYEAGRGTPLAKLDIKSVYRNVPVHPGDRYLLGIQWMDKHMWILVYHSASGQLRSYSMLWQMPWSGSSSMKAVSSRVRHSLPGRLLVRGMPWLRSLRQGLGPCSTSMPRSGLPSHAGESPWPGYGVRLPGLHN